jgi:hypothetical protein
VGVVEDATKETVTRLGPGAYLVNIVPSVVLVAVTWALFSSQLLPWAAPNPAAGAAAVLRAAQGLGVAGGILLLVAVVMVAILLRPFQISAVQILEGRPGG